MTVRLVVDNRVRLDPRTLSERARRDLQDAFTHANPDRSKAGRLERQLADLQRSGRADRRMVARLTAMMFAARKAPAAIVTWREEAGLLTFPRGGMQRVREVLRGHGVAWTVDDRRVDGDVLPTLLPASRVVFRDYQRRLIDACIRRENCLIRSPTGSGKTTALIGVAAEASPGLVLVVVWTGNLLEQWVDRIASELAIPRAEIGVVAGGKVRIGAITVAMQQTLAAKDARLARSLAPRVGMLICDELDRFAARTFVDVVDVFPARFRIGASADERRKDRKEFLIYDLFGAVAAEVSQDELVERRVVHDVEVRLVETDFAPPWLLAMEPAERSLARDRLLEAMAEDGDRNALVARIARREAEAGEQTIAFVERRAHAEALVARLQGAIGEDDAVGTLMGGEESKPEFARSIAGLRAGDVVAAVGTYKAISHGLDMPGVSRGVAVTPIHTDKGLVGQVKGRLCRRAEGKGDAVLYVLWDRALYGRAALANYVRWARTVTVELRSGVVVDGREYLKEIDDAKQDRDTATLPLGG